MKNHLLDELVSSHGLYSLYLPPRRNLGCAVLAAAITDYQSTNDQVHASARKFLFPQTWEYQKHFDWAVGLADGVDRNWLREALDKARNGWDLARGMRKRRTRTAEPSRMWAQECGIFTERKVANE